ncbi:MAG: hypothetical protein A4E56_02901 [Pelotomaculum sp. PtaU1.Bin065]|nr:MAG: hypothetical protein A4E56_02901 [Pelotomaculum sp. PtaU1.Bin065]
MGNNFDRQNGEQKPGQNGLVSKTLTDVATAIGEDERTAKRLKAVNSGRERSKGQNVPLKKAWDKMSCP